MARPEMLSRAAAGAFSSILKILQNSGLASPLGEELGAVLRLHLLPSSVCTEAGRAEVFQGASEKRPRSALPLDCAAGSDARRTAGLLNLYMSAVEEQSCGRTEELNAMSTLHLLLLHFPGKVPACSPVGLGEGRRSQSLGPLPPSQRQDLKLGSRLQGSSNRNSSVQCWTFSCSIPKKWAPITQTTAFRWPS